MNDTTIDQLNDTIKALSKAFLANAELQGELQDAYLENDDLTEQLKMYQQKAANAYLNWMKSQSEVETLRAHDAAVQKTLKNITLDLITVSEERDHLALEVMKYKGLLKRADAMLGRATTGDC